MSSMVAPVPLDELKEWAKQNNGHFLTHDEMRTFLTTVETLGKRLETLEKQQVEISKTTDRVEKKKERKRLMRQSPIFNKTGTSFPDWMATKFRNFLMVNSVEEEEYLCKRLLFHALRGPAFNVSYGPGSAIFNDSSFEDYVAFLAEVFRPHTVEREMEQQLKREAFREEYLALKQGRGQDIVSYLKRKNALFEKAYPVGDFYLSHHLQMCLTGIYSNVIKNLLTRKKYAGKLETFAAVLEEATNIVIIERDMYFAGYGECENLDGLSLKTTNTQFKNRKKGHQ